MYKKMKETVIKNNIVSNPHSDEIEKRLSPFHPKLIISGDKSSFYISIPKNASKTCGRIILDTRAECNWEEKRVISDHELIQGSNGFAVIRDPIERWVGSSLELIKHRLEHYTYEETMNGWFSIDRFKNIENWFDIHYYPQINHFINCDIRNIDFIFLNKNFNNNLEKYLNNNLGISRNITVSELNSSKKENDIRFKIRPMIEEILEDSKFKEKLLDFYKQDYELIEILRKNDEYRFYE